MRLSRSIILAATMALGGCTSLAQFVGTTAQSLSSATPSQARTLAEALQAATLVTDAVDLYVNTGNPSRATLMELQILNDGLHTALGRLQAANAADQSLWLASFNAALEAFNSYATSSGVPH